MSSSNQLPSLLNDQNLKNQIVDHEGIKPYAYQDSKGYWTIGVGRLIDQRKGGKLSMDEIFYLLNNDIRDAVRDLTPYAWFNIQDEVRQGVLVELVFNNGLPHLLGFVKMIAALKNLDYPTAVKELLDSDWARKDVGAKRVADISFRLQFGKYK